VSGFRATTAKTNEMVYAAVSWLHDSAILWDSVCLYSQ